jgi:hypothetical protein
MGGFADDDELEASLSASAALIADFLPAAADRRTHPPVITSSVSSP